ncbi:CHAD domain-containing protein [Elioraea sp.]|uniref:CYTH and CHAD domain-containing protein n=1 Tax=Elioraea sp. TaxID=2185103 RepID=UPI0025C54D15|nr:CHAD domain-containing protein [Elioraea sp.]
MADITIELVLAPEAARHLFRHARPGGGPAAKPRHAAVEQVLSCAADGALGKAGLALVVEKRRRGAVQRLVRCMPADSEIWYPGAPMPVLAETTLPDLQPDLGAFADLLGRDAGVVPQPLAAFSGRRSTLAAGEAGPALSLLSGTLRAVTAEQPIARLCITGERAAVFATAERLAAMLPLSLPATSLVEVARGLARGLPPRPLRQGAPAIAPTAAVAEAFSAIVSHLALAMLAHAPAALAGETPEGVHQMRVALRRLRSALSLFRDHAGPPGTLASSGLKALASRLGPARDWDVFIGGRLAAVRAAFPRDERIGALAADATAAREAAYARLREALDTPGFRLLSLSLAALAQGEREAPEPASAFAAKALQKRLKRVLRHGEDLAGLPVEALHALRLDAKRLRYAAEMFGQLFSPKKARRFLRALAAVQEELGHINDAAVAATLLGHLAEPHEARAFAVGVVEGWIAAKSDGAREAAFKAWDKFLERETFWD